jgi:hypothetical protein
MIATIFANGVKRVIRAVIVIAVRSASKRFAHPSCQVGTGVVVEVTPQLPKYGGAKQIIAGVRNLLPIACQK